MRSMAGAHSTFSRLSGYLTPLRAPASPNSRSSLVSVSVPRAFLPVGAGFFSSGTWEQGRANTPNKNTKGITWKSSLWPS